MDSSAADHDMDDVVNIKEEPGNGVGPASAAGADKVQHRKPHQKSRMGCTQCKARRVKVRVKISFMFVSNHIFDDLHDLSLRFPKVVRTNMHKIKVPVNQSQTIGGEEAVAERSSNTSSYLRLTFPMSPSTVR
jgi:hypothetical protein